MRNSFFSSSNFAKDRNKGFKVFQIEDYLQDDEQEVLYNLNKLAKDVYLNPKLAKDFENNPDYLLEQYGISSGIELNPNSPQVRVIIALADESVVNALNQKDFVRYISLLEAKGILDRGTLLSSITLKPRTKMSNDLRSTNLAPDSDRLSPISFFILLAGVLIYVAGVTIALGAVAAEVLAAVHFSLGAYGLGASSITQDSTYRLFLDKSNMSSKDLVNALYEKGYISDQEMDLIKGLTD